MAHGCVDLHGLVYYSAMRGYYFGLLDGHNLERAALGHGYLDGEWILGGWREGGANV